MEIDTIMCLSKFISLEVILCHLLGVLVVQTLPTLANLIGMTTEVAIQWMLCVVILVRYELILTLFFDMLTLLNN
jgi:hypothetical protein